MRTLLKIIWPETRWSENVFGHVIWHSPKINWDLYSSRRNSSFNPETTVLFRNHPLPDALILTAALPVPLRACPCTVCRPSNPPASACRLYDCPMTGFMAWASLGFPYMKQIPNITWGISHMPVMPEPVECYKSEEARGSVVLKALCYRPEGHGFETRWGEWTFSICLILPVPEYTQPVPEMSTRNRKVMFLGSRARPVCRVDKFTAICEPIV
jgi:hypothetical protein